MVLKFGTTLRIARAYLKQLLVVHIATMCVFVQPFKAAFILCMSLGCCILAYLQVSEAFSHNGCGR